MNFQSYAYGMNHWEADKDLQHVLQLYWPGLNQHQQDLWDFGQLAGTEIYETAYHIDHDAGPVLIMHDLDGKRVDRVRFSPAEKGLLKKLAFINRPPYEGGSWHHHFAYGYMLADPGLYCVLTITNQTAYAIHKYASDQVTWKEKLLSGEMYGATWMSENQGGSDLGANETQAVNENGYWKLTGDKFFASGAGLTDVAITTARPEGATAGPKGLALFLLPREINQGELNFHVRRLKDKSATRAVPSGEVELNRSEAILIGKAEEGIYYTLENLTVSRLANGIAAMGIAKKAHLEVLERVKRRHSFGHALIDHPLIRRDLTELAVRTAAGTALAFHAVHAFDSAWTETPPYSARYHYARFLSHLAKNRTAAHASAVTALAMELFGGLGFMDEYAVARWHREALITPIWEGPSNIQALDFLEAMQKKKAHESFLSDFLPTFEQENNRESQLAKNTVEQVLSQMGKYSPHEAQWYAKDALNQLADAAQIGLLLRLAKTGGDRYYKLAKLYAIRFLQKEEFPSWAYDDPELWRG